MKSRALDRTIWHETVDPRMDDLFGTLYSLGNGHLGLRGVHEEEQPWSRSGFYIGGTYTAAPLMLVPVHPADHILVDAGKVHDVMGGAFRDSELETLPNLPFPLAVRLYRRNVEFSLDMLDRVSCERQLFLEEKLAARRLVVKDCAGKLHVIDSERFASFRDRKLLCLSYVMECPDGEPSLEAFPCIRTEVANDRNLRLFRVEWQVSEADFNALRARLSNGDPVFYHQTWRRGNRGRAKTLEVFCGISMASMEEARNSAETASSQGYTAAREEHVSAVSLDHERGKADFGGDLYARQGLRFGLMHLEMALPRDNPGASLTVKSLTGEGYKFVVLWDTEFHMFPYVLFTRPEEARNLLMYRYLRLGEARANARKNGYRGAQYPWESAGSGREASVPWLVLPNREIHISADIAYAVKLYHDFSGDGDFLIRHGAEIVFETARFFASRCVHDAVSDRYEFRDVGCPDQYHTTADNNPFICRMAKWNLAWAAELGRDPALAAVAGRIGLEPDEIDGFSKIAQRVHVPGPGSDSIIEEFEGYFGLDDDLRGINERFCRHSQAVKQPDVLLLMKYFGDEYPPEIQRANWKYYMDRTLHGSSLSVTGMALAAARAGLLAESHDCFTRGARADLDGIRPDSDLGVHLAGYAVLWETLVFGYGGFLPHRDRLTFEPNLPAAMDHVEFAITWRRNCFQVRVDHTVLELSAARDNPDTVRIGCAGTEFNVAPGQSLRSNYGPV